MWLREGNRAVNIRQPLMTADIDARDVRFSEVVVFQLDESMSVKAITHADEARPVGGVWILDNVNETLFAPTRVDRQDSTTMTWEIELDPNLLEAAITRPGYLSIRALNNYANYLDEHDQDARIYVTAFWQKLAYPFSVLALVLVALASQPVDGPGSACGR